MRITRVAVVLAAGAVAGAGCGGSDGSSGGSTPTPAAATSTAASKAAGGGTKAVDIKDFAFEPKSLTVPAGTKVSWTNEDTANHNVDFKSGGAPKGIANLRQGQKASVTFTKPGTYAYVCDFHSNMKATIIVR